MLNVSSLVEAVRRIHDILDEDDSQELLVQLLDVLRHHPLIGLKRSIETSNFTNIYAAFTFIHPDRVIPINVYWSCIASSDEMTLCAFLNGFQHNLVTLIDALEFACACSSKIAIFCILVYLQGSLQTQSVPEFVRTRIRQLCNVYPHYAELLSASVLLERSPVKRGTLSEHHCGVMRKAFRRGQYLSLTSIFLTIPPSTYMSPEVYLDLIHTDNFEAMAHFLSLYTHAHETLVEMVDECTTANALQCLALVVLHIRGMSFHTMIHGDIKMKWTAVFDKHPHVSSFVRGTENLCVNNELISTFLNHTYTVKSKKAFCSGLSIKVVTREFLEWQTCCTPKTALPDRQVMNLLRNSVFLRRTRMFNPSGQCRYNIALRATSQETDVEFPLMDDGDSVTMKLCNLTGSECPKHGRK